MPPLKPLKKRPVARRKLSEIVFEQLIELIREEGYAPGDPLPTERELMETFGVGRPVVREALQRLEGMGMISIQHGERAKVRQLDMHALIQQLDVSARHLLSTSAESVDHLREARVFFETGLVRIVAERADADALERLRAALERMRTLRDAPRSEFIPADMAFHLEIARISGNPIYLAVAKAILEWMADYRRDMLRFKGTEVSIAEHERIFERVEQGDAEGAERAMRDHLTAAGGG